MSVIEDGLKDLQAAYGTSTGSTVYSSNSTKANSNPSFSITPSTITVLKEGLLEIRESVGGIYQYVHVDNIQSLASVQQYGKDCTIFSLNDKPTQFWVDKPIHVVRLAIRVACGNTLEDAESDLGMEALRDV